MTPRQLEIIQHALGTDKYGQGAKRRGVAAHPDYFPYHRNHFCAGTADEPDCRALVELGFMQQHETTKWLTYFNCSVTENGIKAMRNESPAPPKLTRSQLRYQEFRDASDAFNCTFREFLKIQKEPWYQEMKARG